MSTVLWLLYDFVSLKNDLNVLSIRNEHKNYFLLASWRSLIKRVGSGTVSQRYRSEEDPDPYQNVTDPKHFKGAQAWEFFDWVFCTKRIHLGMWRRDCKKNRIFYRLTPDFDGFGFFAAYWVCGKQKKYLKLGQNKKLLVGAFEPICMPTMSFSKMFKVRFFYECLKNLRRINFFSTYTVGVE
jgi:hypothetical protein